MIYIGGVYGGPEVRGSRIDRAIGRLLKLRPEEQEGSSGSLDFVFHIPGSVFVPDFRGPRTAKFSKKERMLMIQVGVSPEMVQADDPDITAFLLASLREGIRLAEPVFRKAKIPYDLDHDLAIVDGMERGLVQ